MVNIISLLTKVSKRGPYQNTDTVVEPNLIHFILAGQVVNGFYLPYMICG